MKRILDTVMPVGAPWGGPESFRYPSCFVSMLMYLDHYDGSEPCWCARDLRPCRDCGECHATPIQHKHEELYRLYMAVSGIGLGTVCSDEFLPCTLNSSIAVAENDYIAWSMQYAGYRYSTMARDGGGGNSADLKERIVAAIDRDVPVLACSLAGTDWSIITGYDHGGDTLIGWYENWYGRAWEPAVTRPDGYLENKMFHKAGWYDTLSRILIVEGKTQREMPYHQVFRNMIAVLERQQSMGFAVGFRAYEAPIDLLNDDERFQAADADALRRMYAYTHGFIGTLAEARWTVGDIFSGGFLDDLQDKELLARLRNSVGRYLLETHDICWDAWRAMGESHICEPDKYAERFRRPEVRRSVAEMIAGMAENDRRTLAELKACTEPC